MVKRVQSGFTLIEVVIAIAVVSVAMVTLVESLGVYLNNTQNMKERVLAQWVAKNVMNKEWLAKKTQISTGVKTGQEPMANNNWYWKREIKETSTKGFYTYDVDVFRNKNDENAVYTLNGFVGEGMVACSFSQNSDSDCH